MEKIKAFLAMEKSSFTVIFRRKQASRGAGILRGREIQQKLPNDRPDDPPYFFSLFDPSTNTPFYSAYKVTPSQAMGIGANNRNAVRNVNWRNPIGM